MRPWWHSPCCSQPLVPILDKEPLEKSPSTQIACENNFLRFGAVLTFWQDISGRICLACGFEISTGLHLRYPSPSAALGPGLCRAQLQSAIPLLHGSFHGGHNPPNFFTSGYPRPRSASGASFCTCNSRHCHFYSIFPSISPIICTPSPSPAFTSPVSSLLSCSSNSSLICPVLGFGALWRFFSFASGLSHSEFWVEWMGMCTCGKNCSSFGYVVQEYVFLHFL